MGLAEICILSVLCLTENLRYSRTLSSYQKSTNILSFSCYLIFSLMCMFSRSLFVLLYFFFWSLSCLFFFDLQILITSLWYLQTLLLSSTTIYHLCLFPFIKVFNVVYMCFMHINHKGRFTNRYLLFYYIEINNNHYLLL